MKFTLTADSQPWQAFREAALHQHPTQLSPTARTKVAACADYLGAKLGTHEEAIYGVNTGFGDLCNQQIPAHQLHTLQLNLVRSHACGVGPDAPEEVVRLMLLLKAKSLAFGYSGIQPATLDRLIDLFNHNLLPVVPTLGSLGASGDLAPLAHLALPLIGEGEVVWQGNRMPAAGALAALGWKPIDLQAKEGLALLNGTQFMLAYGLAVLGKALHLLEVADVLAALSIDAFGARLEPFHPRLHEIRPHQGQGESATRIRLLLEGSALAKAPRKQVQDAYSFRCIPQVHGASRDALRHVASVFETETNSVSDNPNIFAEEDLILSGGNFHGQPLALSLDFLTLAVAEIASLAERRIFQLLSGERGLPPFLAVDPGLESGLMIPQYTAAALVSRNKHLCMPASADSLPSSNNQEDHVSMGSLSAIKAWEVVNNAEQVLGIELLCASQALFFREPARTSPMMDAWLTAFRAETPPLTGDRLLHPDLLRAGEFVRNCPLP